MRTKVNCVIWGLICQILGMYISFGSETTSLLGYSTAISNDCELSIKTTNNVYAVGQRIQLNVFVKNTSTNLLPFVIHEGLMDYSLKVTGPGSVAVPITDYGNRLFAPVVLYHQLFEDIQPNHYWHDEIPLNKVFVMTNAGEYKIIVTREINDKQTMTAGPLNILLTNSVGNF